MREESAKTTELSRKIREFKEKRKAVILAHFYQRPEVQDVADFVGDSLQLAQQAAGTDARVIVFCGVCFMAECAKILSPDKIVVLPEEEAGCPLANMATAAAVRAKKEEVPDCLVVTYVNSSAAVKAESDICCTSSNALKVISSLPKEKPVLFVPDRNLGHYLSRQTGRGLILWDGYCHVHDRLTAGEIEKARAAHPEAAVMVHPECRPEVIDLADHVASTGGMLKYAGSAPFSAFIIGTEQGMLYPLQKAYPDKTFYPAASHMVCPNMKLTTLEKVKQALEDLEPRIEVAPEIRDRARRALTRMLELS
ncbi:MAG: quinolinate synthase NadA [Bacillota bacterium]|jgi:quinolinate synthase|nr:quinolinate synthase NadA [Bacillota bacterium]